MRYYCESAHSLNHTSGSISLFERQVDAALIKPPTNVLDLGCGNGRNSLYIAKKYGASVTLVDKDESLLNWAKEQFSIAGFAPLPDAICLPIEELTVNPSAYLPRLSRPDARSETFDLVILSYVIQHIDPAYYPLVFDFCKNICGGYLLLDVFWNPSRVMEGERISFGDVDWYGLSYEELATIVAPRFSISADKVMKNDIAVVINMALSPGETPLGTILAKQFEYCSGRIRNRGMIRPSYTNHRRVPPRFNLDDLPCVQMLESLYPDRLDFVKSELQQWIEANRRASVSVLAAKFLWLCRSSKIPVMLSEVSADFHISTRALLGILSATSYVPPLLSSEYVERFTRQLQLPEYLEEDAKRLVNGDGLTGASPIIRACSAILKTARVKGIKLTLERLAQTASVTPTAIRNALHRS